MDRPTDMNALQFDMTVKFYFLYALAQRLAELFRRDYSICRSKAHHVTNIMPSAAIFLTKSLIRLYMKNAA